MSYMRVICVLLAQCSLPPTLQWTQNLFLPLSSAAALSSAWLPRRAHFPVGAGLAAALSSAWLPRRAHFPVGSLSSAWLPRRAHFPVGAGLAAALSSARLPRRAHFPVGAVLLQYSRTIQCTTTTVMAFSSAKSAKKNMPSLEIMLLLCMNYLPALPPLPSECYKKT